MTGGALKSCKILHTVTVLYVTRFGVSADDDVFYLFLQKQKIGAKLHIYLWEGTYHTRLFRGPSTNDMRK